MPNPERLFRDGDGAALERVARLEDENRRLRAEVERLANAPPAALREMHPPRGERTPTLPGRFLVLAMALPVALLTLLLTVEPHHHARYHAASPYGEGACPRAFDPPPFLPLVDDGAPVTTMETPSCASPFLVDAHGDRQPKAECIH